jgi:hypothetical protein
MLAGTLLFLFLTLAATRALQFGYELADPAAGVPSLKNLKGKIADCRFAKPNRGCSIPSVVDTKARSVMIKNEGTTSCTTYVEESQVGPSTELWVLSFLSTEIFDDLESGLTNSLPLINQAAIQSWLRSYCQAHPLDTIALASAWLVSDLRLGRFLRHGNEIREGSTKTRGV